MNNHLKLLIIVGSIFGTLFVIAANSKDGDGIGIAGIGIVLLVLILFTYALAKAVKAITKK